MANPMSALLDAGLVKEMTMPVGGQKKRRRIDQNTGRALVVLGHAIEYLADEFVYAAETLQANRGQLEAIQLLMAKNRDLYLACPEAPTFWQGLHSLFHVQRPQTAGAGQTALNQR